MCHKKNPYCFCECVNLFKKKTVTHSPISHAWVVCKHNALIKYSMYSTFSCAFYFTKKANKKKYENIQ